MPWFRKHHTCPCGTDWWDEWDCLCNDRCPTCDAEIEPDEHEAIQGAKSAKIRRLNDRFRKSLTGGCVMRPRLQGTGLDDGRMKRHHTLGAGRLQRAGLGSDLHAPDPGQLRDVPQP